MFGGEFSSGFAVGEAGHLFFVFVYESDDGLRVFLGHFSERPADGFSDKKSGTLSFERIFVCLVYPRLVELGSSEVKKELFVATGAFAEEQELSK